MSNNQLYARAKEAHEVLGISRTAFWRLTKKDDFPKKITLGGSVVYKISEIVEWVDNQRDLAS